MWLRSQTRRSSGTSLRSKSVLQTYSLPREQVRSCSAGEGQPGDHLALEAPAGVRRTRVLHDLRGATVAAGASGGGPHQGDGSGHRPPETR